MNKKQLAHRIFVINNKTLCKMVFDMAQWFLQDSDFKAGVFEMDILNALEDIDEVSLSFIENETKKYRVYTASFIKYGYYGLYAKTKDEAIQKANSRSAKGSEINWSENLHCFKIAPTRYIHEFRVCAASGLKRVTYGYDKPVAMTKIEIQEFLSRSHLFPSETTYVVDYSFIQDSVIKKEKQYNLSL